MKIPRIVALAALLIVFTSAWTMNEPVVEWISAHAVRLQTPEAGHGFADMQPLKTMIGNSRIVSLGEATHGTREFFQLKHRMLEFLATEMGFTIFSIEANMPEAYRLNDYVLNGNGDPAKLIEGMYFWTWNTQEVLDMVRWMREFNKSGKGRVQFTGFDMQTPNVAMDIVRDFVAKSDPEYAGMVHLAADLTNATSSPKSFGVAGASFPVKAGVTKRVHLSGYIKAEGVINGYAGFWLRVDGASNMLALDNMDGRGATGTADWKRYDIELSVPAEAKSIVFGPIFPGDGTAWFDSLIIELDGVPYSDNSAFDPDFESPSVRGFYAGGDGYEVQLDNQVFHTGKQSLRMRHLPSAASNDSKAVDPRFAVSGWKEVLAHLEDSRDKYRAKGATEREIHWAIQNARVVMQYSQMRTNEVTRDRSMADNVKWILDNNPGAKIVLWAHNGHVSTLSGGGYEPMGASLRKMFGDQMVVFGFAFNQGSFRAVEPTKKGLVDFTVPPAPTGSLDATFASAGIPLFALDLRDAPKSGPIATWLSEPHKTRSIGSMYSEDSAAQYLFDLKAPQSFDVMLFVEKTTAARKNP